MSATPSTAAEPIRITPLADASVYYNRSYLQAAAKLEPQGTLHHFRHGSAEIPLVVRPLPKHCGAGFDVISPYDFSGPLLRDEPVADVWSAIIDWARAHDVVTGFFRFHPFVGEATRWASCPGMAINHVCDNVVVELGDEASLLERCKPAVARDLKVAVRAKVDCAVSAMTHGGVCEFVPMYHETMARRNASTYYLFPRTYFDELIDSLDSSILLATARIDNSVVAAAMVLLDGPIAFYYLACANEAGRRVCAMNMLVLKTAGALSEIGMRRFHLGGGREGLLAFKQRFGSQRAPFYTGQAVFDETRYAELSSGLNTDYFPTYRASD